MDLKRVENFVGKGENAGYQHFLLFPKCFLKVSFSGMCGNGLMSFDMQKSDSKQEVSAKVCCKLILVDAFCSCSPLFPEHGPYTYLSLDETAIF